VETKKTVKKEKKEKPKVIVKITYDHVNKSIPGNGLFNPIGYAMADKLKELKLNNMTTFVDDEKIILYLWKRGLCYIEDYIMLSPALKEWNHKFNTGDVISDIEFDLLTLKSDKSEIYRPPPVKEKR